MTSRIDRRSLIKCAVAAPVAVAGPAAGASLVLPATQTIKVDIDTSCFDAILKDIDRKASALASVGAKHLGLPNGWQAVAGRELDWDAAPGLAGALA